MPSILSGVRNGTVPPLPFWLAISLVAAFLLSLMRAATRPPSAGTFSQTAIFSSPLVSPAPAPIFDKDALVSNMSDVRGTYVRITFASAASSSLLYSNLIYTRKGFYRSGDLHVCNQVNSMVSGRAEIITADPSGATKRRVFLAGETIVTPAGVPHLFLFQDVESIMSEHWVHASNGSLCEYRAWFYAPFRDLIAKQLSDAAKAREAPASRIDVSKVLT
jgi:hypothetical protein